MKIATLTQTFSYYSNVNRIVNLQVQEYSKKDNKVIVFALKAEIRDR